MLSGTACYIIYYVLLFLSFGQNWKKNFTESCLQPDK